MASTISGEQSNAATSTSGSAGSFQSRHGAHGGILGVAEDGTQVGMGGNQVLSIGLALGAVHLFHLLEIHVHQAIGGNAFIEAVLAEHAVDPGLVQSDLRHLGAGLQLGGNVLADGLAAGQVGRC